jgi:hypothetical protein
VGINVAEPEPVAGAATLVGIFHNFQKLSNKCVNGFYTQTILNNGDISYRTLKKITLLAFSRPTQRHEKIM